MFRTPVVAGGGQSLDDELRSLIQADRMEKLQGSLRPGPVGVVETTYRRGGSRVAFALSTGAVLDLRLFWPIRQAVVALVSIHFDERIGWVAVGCTAEGGHIALYAWLATLHEQ